MSQDARNAHIKVEKRVELGGVHAAILNRRASSGSFLLMCDEDLLP